MTFQPAPDTEKGQVKIFCGRETLDARFDAAFIRINPGDFESTRARRTRCTARPVDPRDFQRADEVFREESTKSFGLDLGDLSRDAWSLLPAPRRLPRRGPHAPLRHAHLRAVARPSPRTSRSSIARQRRNIALYASEDKLARRGPLLQRGRPRRLRRPRLQHRRRRRARPAVDRRARPAAAEGATRTRSARSRCGWPTRSPCSRSSATSSAALFGIRVKQPEQHRRQPADRRSRRTRSCTLTIAYCGPARAAGRRSRDDRRPAGRRPGARRRADRRRPSRASSTATGAYWYPQAPITDYATATHPHHACPPSLDCVASGELQPGLADAGREPRSGAAAQGVHLHGRAAGALPRVHHQPVRAGRTRRRSRSPTPIRHGDGRRRCAASPTTRCNLSVEANPRQVQHGRDLAERAADIAQFYASLVGDCPYPSFTLARHRERPAGRPQPGVLRRAQPAAADRAFTWRNDPAAFDELPGVLPRARSWRTSGGDRRSAGATTTSSG